VIVTETGNSAREVADDRSHGLCTPTYGGRMEVRWEDSDAWVFAAISGSGPDNGSTLAEVVRRGDAIDHAVMSEAEFARAVPRLINAGLIGGDRVLGRYWRTQAGQELFERHMKRRGLFGWADAIPPALRRLGPPQDGSWELASGEYDRATREYQRWAAKTIGRTGRQRSDGRPQAGAAGATGPQESRPS
jgi:hypothetical protein